MNLHIKAIIEVAMGKCWTELVTAKSVENHTKHSKTESDKREQDS